MSVLSVCSCSSKEREAEFTADDADKRVLQKVVSLATKKHKMLKKLILGCFLRLFVARCGFVGEPRSTELADL